MPARPTAADPGGYNVSPECWLVYTEVLGTEFGNALLYGHAHQLTVDTYAVQHPGPLHPDKSIGIHLGGLHLALKRDVRPPRVPPLLQRLADAIDAWPHLSPPADLGPLTVCDVALAGSVEGHIDAVERWSRQVWGQWAEHHDQVRGLVGEHLHLDARG